MKGTIPCGRWTGIPIGIHWSAVATVVLIAYVVALDVLPGLAPGLSAVAYWTAGTAAAVLLMASLLAHELAHTATALRLGMRVRAMTLWLLGGQTELEGDAPDPRTELRIALAGPLASAAVGGLFAGLTALSGYAGWPAVVRACLAWLALVNLVLAAFNLLPAIPMDGGRVLHALLWRRRGTDRATAITATVGRMIGSLLIGFGVVVLFGGDLVDGMWLGLLGWFLMTAAVGEEANTVRRTQFAKVAVRDVMTPADTIAPAWFTVGSFLDQVASTAHRRVFAVVDFTGQPFGVLSLAMLTRASAERLRTARVADVCRKLSDTIVVAPDSTLADLVTAAQHRGGAIAPALVVDGSTMVGTIGDDDLARAIELVLLRQSSNAADVAVHP
jgi:Zn-dependent protease